MFCPNCGKEISKEFKFCPHCGFHQELALSSTALANPNQENEASTTNPNSQSPSSIGLEPVVLAREFDSVETGAKIYQNAKKRIREIGIKFGYVPVREFFYSSRDTPDRWSKIDIIWKLNGKFAAAFNIKSKEHGLSSVEDFEQVMRLNNFPADQKYVVNVSKKTGRAYFNQVTNESIELFKLQMGKPFTNAHNNANPSNGKAYDVTAIRQEHERAYEKWTEKEDEELSEDYHQGLTGAQMAEKHHRQIGAIHSRLTKLGLFPEFGVTGTLSEENVSSSEVVTTAGESVLLTFLVKSEKNRKICLACVDEDKRWVRPIKPGGFEEKDIVMDNGKAINIFDVVRTRFSSPFPVNHHKENMRFTPGTSISFVRKLDENEQELFLSEISNAQVLNRVRSKEELFDELSVNLAQSLVLAGPEYQFNIQYNVGENHPRIWIVRQNEPIFNVSCTDLKFCKFLRSKFANLETTGGVICSKDIPELKDKKTYFVVGLTGDSLDERSQIIDGKWRGRYWPLIVSILTVPNYSSEE